MSQKRYLVKVFRIQLYLVIVVLKFIEECYCCPEIDMKFDNSFRELIVPHSRFWCHHSSFRRRREHIFPMRYLWYLYQTP